MPAAKDAHALTTYYVKAYESLHKDKPNVNRHSARWGFDSILMDLSVEQTQSLIDFYLGNGEGKAPSLSWFFSNYEKLIANRQEIMEDRAHRQRLREETEKRVKEWRERVDKQGTTDNQFGSKE